ncbi:hypothetical protein PLICRDRAFT_37865 [Plicaturopsis crispa FD-325 SS-3]|nr:hypothetical protein PLICRDRAFT_37865 [Plicaturopsis crispa FD-325 SS-3]
MASPEPDASFAALPSSLRRKIDTAFDSDAYAGSEPSSKKRRLNGGDSVSAAAHGPDYNTPGGFELDDTPGGFVDESAGGFIASPPPSQPQIPLSRIPAALEALGLHSAAADDEVLEVFRNAASGWGNKASDEREEKEEDGAAVVSRDDFRAVCAVLFEREGMDVDPGPEPADAHASDALVAPDAGGFVEDDDEPEGGDNVDIEGDDYEQSDLSSLSESAGDSADEYREGPSSRRVRGRPKRQSSASTPDRSLRKAAGGPKDLTPSQRASVLETFALFFPDDGAKADPKGKSAAAKGTSTSTSEDIRSKRLTPREVQRAMAVLKEKGTNAEITEMVATFSSPSATGSPSMGLAEFERMMIACGLV